MEAKTQGYQSNQYGQQLLPPDRQSIKAADALVECDASSHLEKKKDYNHSYHSHRSQTSSRKRGKSLPRTNNADCILVDDPDFQERLDKGWSALNKLAFITGVCFCFMIVEFIGGWISNSMAIMTDAAHMASDTSGFLISILSILAARWNPTLKNSFGYHRYEVLGALASIVIIWVLIAWLVVEAISRVHKCIHHETIEFDPEVMLITSIISLVCNIVNLIVLGECGCSGDHEGGLLANVKSISIHENNEGHSDASSSDSQSQSQVHIQQVDRNLEIQAENEHQTTQKMQNGYVQQQDQASERPRRNKDATNINVQAAIVHLVGDVIQSVGVIIASVVIIYEPNWLIVDPLCTFLFSILVMCTTLPTFQVCVHYLMEGTPEEVRTDRIRADILAIPAVAAIDDFHCWGLAGDKFFLTAHVYIKDSYWAKCTGASQAQKLLDIESNQNISVSVVREIEPTQQFELLHLVHEKCNEIAKRNNVCHATFQIL